MDKLDRMDVDILLAGLDPNAPGINKPSALRLMMACQALARDLLELHDRTGISLDNWHSARTFVEAFTGPITENHA